MLFTMLGHILVKIKPMLKHLFTGVLGISRLSCNCFINRYAKKNGYPVLYNVVLPRVGALGTVLSTLPTTPKHQNGSNGVSGNQQSGKCTEYPPVICVHKFSVTRV